MDNIKRELRKLLDTAPKMDMSIDWPREYGERLYPEMQVWTAKLAVLAGCATRTQEVTLLQAK